MANPSQSSLAGLSAFSSGPTTKRPRLHSVPPPENSSPPPPESTVLPVEGPRKLVRPKLSDCTLATRPFLRRDDPPALTNQRMNRMMAGSAPESSNAEAFYLQKQVQTQTAMVIVLDDGQQVEGLIEWYDRNTIKVRGTTRMLIYKSAIKYLYKAAEKHA